MVDTDKIDLTAQNLILVAGPCANSLVTKVDPSLTCAGWKLPSGQALLKVVDSGTKVALIVAGTDAADTLMAAKELALVKGGLSGAEKVLGTATVVAAEASAGTTTGTA